MYETTDYDAVAILELENAGHMGRDARNCGIRITLLCTASTSTTATSRSPIATTPSLVLSLSMFKCRGVSTHSSNSTASPCLSGCWGMVRCTSWPTPRPYDVRLQNQSTRIDLRPVLRRIQMPLTMELRDRQLLPSAKMVFDHVDAWNSQRPCSLSRATLRYSRPMLGSTGEVFLMDLQDSS